MRFLNLEARNFLSWESLELSLDRRGLVFIHGENGVGKSALFDAIEWCLFKKLSRAVPVGDVIRTAAGRDCSVTLTFTEIPGSEDSVYRVSRYRRHKQFGDRLVIYKDRKDITPSTAPASESRLQSIIGMSRPAFNNSLLFSQDSKFWFSVFSDATQKSVLRELMGLIYLHECRKVVDKRGSEIDRRITDLSARKDILKSRLVASDYDSSGIGDIKRSLDAIEALIARRKSNPFRDEVATLIEKKQSVRSKINLMPQPHTGNVCKVCGSASKCHKCGTRTRPSPKILLTQREHLEKTYKALSDKLDVVEYKSQSYDQESRKLDVYRANYAGQLKSMRTSKLKSSQANAELQEELERVNVKLRKALREEKYAQYWKKGFSQRGVELLVLRRVLPALNKHIGLRLDHLLPGASLSFGIGEGGTIEHNLEMKHPGARKLGALSTGQKRRVDLATALALQSVMTLYTGVSHNLLMMDEVFEGLSAKGVLLVVDLLKSMATKGKSIFVVSHQAGLQDHFNNTLEIELIQGVSRFAS